jgi:phage terminase Nu1 subunit (DNA packaging protein)
MASAAEAAAHLDLSRVAFSELMAKGIVKKPDGRAAFDLGEVRFAYIRHLRKIASGRAGGPNADRLTDERVLWTAAKRRREEMAEAVALGQYVSARAVVLVVASYVAQVREHLLALPGKWAALLVGRSFEEIDETLTDEIFEALDDLAAAKISADIAEYGREGRRRRHARTNGGDDVDGVGLDA